MAACGGRVCVFVHRTITHYADLAPRGCQCGHELRPASNSGSCLPPGVGAPGKLSYHPRPPTLRQGGSDVCLRGEAGPAAAGMLVPSLPACPQPQPCRAVVCTRPSGAARERPGPRTGNGRSDGLDGVPRTQKCPQARSVPGSPPRTGSPGLARTLTTQDPGGKAEHSVGMLWGHVSLTWAPLSNLPFANSSLNTTRFIGLV